MAEPVLIPGNLVWAIMGVGGIVCTMVVTLFWQAMGAKNAHISFLERQIDEKLVPVTEKLTNEVRENTGVGKQVAGDIVEIRRDLRDLVGSLSGPRGSR